MAVAHAPTEAAAAAAASAAGVAAAGERGRPTTTAFRGVPAAYFEEAADVGRAAFDAAAAREAGDEGGDDGARARSYDLGGLRLCVRYAGRAVETAVHRALAHLELPAPASSPSPSPDLTVTVWDEARAARLLPEPHPHMLVDYRNHCLELCSDGRYLALDERWLGTRAYVDRRAGEAWACVRDVAALPYYEKTAPLRSVLNALLVARGRHLAHAAAVGLPDRGVLLAGAPGAGKSSTALACLAGGLRYLADDFCGVALSEAGGDGGAGAPRVFSVYAGAKLRRDGLERFPEMRPLVDGVERLGQEKATTFVSEHWRDRMLASCPARAILIPEVTGRARSAVEPTAGRDAWRALMSWTLKQLGGWRRESIELLTRFCAPLPAYRLLLGTDRDEVRATVEDFVGGL